ncbi:MAG: Cna B-type domain-containing protein [Eggerthella lenta]
MKVRTLLIGAALGLALCLPVAPGMTAEAAEDTVQITDIEQLVPYVPDAIFRQAVFDAVKDGADGAEGADVEEALYNFRGTVLYNKSNATPSDQKIKDVHGIQYLRNAQLVSLKYNEIRDFSWLERSGGLEDKYYGELLANDPTIEIDERNVVWDFGGNPFEMLPTFFGGRLKIMQPASSSFTYSEDVSQHLAYVRPAGETAVSGALDIGKSAIYEHGAKIEDAHVVECGVHTRPGDAATSMVIASHNDTTAAFTGLEKSGVFHIYVGMDKELKYGTQDEWGAITEGEQSYKYYLTPTFRVYDRITAASAAGSSAVLTKTDSTTNAPVAGATYAVYTDKGAFVEERTTDDAGSLSTSSLLPGAYYFQETEAPTGYLLNDKKIPFTIVEGTTGATTSVGGGESQVTTSDGQTVNASANERLFAGGKDGSGTLLSPDLELSSSNPDDVVGVQVTYDKLDGDRGGDNVVRTFDSLTDAQADINAEKGDNAIMGPVSVTARYRTSTAAPVQVQTSDEPVEAIDIPVKKHWQDNPDWHGTRADVTIRLWCGGDEVGTWTLIGGEPSEGGADDFDHVFTGLPKTDQYGNDLVYEVTEDPVRDASGITGNYISTIDADPAVDNGVIVSNLYNVAEKFYLTGQKTWSGDTEADRPASVSLTLTQTNASGHAPYIFKTTASAPDWTYTFTNIPLLEGSERATYQLTETPVNGYTSFVPIANIQGTGDIETVVVPGEQTVNKIKRVDVAGTKTWHDDDNALGTRPAAITVNLYQDDVLFDTATATADDGWAYQFTGLPEAAANGAIHVYTVQEEAVEHYATVIDGTAIANTLDPKLNDIAEVKGTKTWDDNDNAGNTRPESITVELLDGDDVVKLLETTEADGWAYAFAELPKYADDGTEIAYTVREKDVPAGYEAAVSGHNIANTLKPQPGGDTVEVAGTKTWVDNDNAGTTRPETLTVSLYQNDKLFRTQETSAQRDWAYRFADLPRFDADGKEFAYSIREDAVPNGYTASVKGYDLTNTLSEIPQKPKDPTPTDAPHKLAATGDAPFAAVALGATFAAALLVVATFRKRRRA